MKLSKLLLILLLPIILSCNEKKVVDYVIFSGTIKGVHSDSLKIFDKDYNPIQTIYLTKERTFIDTLFIPKGYYHIGDFKTLTKLLFLKPSYNLKVSIISNDKGLSISFEGDENKENNYIQEKENYNKTFKQVENYKYYLNLNEEDFLKLIDSINIVKKTFLKSHQNLEDDFLLYESFVLESEKTSFLQNYQKWHGEFIKDPDFIVSNKYPNPFEKINISNEKLLAHPDFIKYLSGYISFKMADNTTSDNYLKQLETIEREIKNQKIKDRYAYEQTKLGISQTKILDEVYNKYMSMVENKAYRDEIEEIYSNLKKISKGAVSPMFELYDINNCLVTLESLRGKLVYIDIWGTWCIPCIKEIPVLKALEKEFRGKDIYFVSISIKDTKENFKNFVLEKELEGIQLFAPNSDISFFNDYQLKTVPRFILIDKEGKILDANAYKPSDPKLKELIMGYL